MKFATVKRALYSYKGQREDELSVGAGEVVLEVASDGKCDAGWLPVSNARSELGVVPAEFVEDAAALFDCTAMFDFRGCSEEEVSMAAGDVLSVYHAPGNEDWWIASGQAGVGYIPSSYVTLEDISRGGRGGAAISISDFHVDPDEDPFLKYIETAYAPRILSAQELMQLRHAFGAVLLEGRKRTSVILAFSRENDAYVIIEASKEVFVTFQRGDASLEDEPSGEKPVVRLLCNNESFLLELEKSSDKPKIRQVIGGERQFVCNQPSMSETGPGEAKAAGRSNVEWDDQPPEIKDRPNVEWDESDTGRENDVQPIEAVEWGEEVVEDEKAKVLASELPEITVQNKGESKIEWEEDGPDSSQSNHGGLFGKSTEVEAKPKHPDAYQTKERELGNNATNRQRQKSNPLLPAKESSTGNMAREVGLQKTPPPRPALSESDPVGDGLSNQLRNVKLRPVPKRPDCPSWAKASREPAGEERPACGPPRKLPSLPTITKPKEMANPSRPGAELAKNQKEQIAPPAPPIPPKVNNQTVREERPPIPKAPSQSVSSHDLASSAAKLTRLSHLGESAGQQTPNPQSVRLWSDRTGAFSTEAVFIRYCEGKVYLRRPNGMNISVPVDSLSTSDIDYLKTVDSSLSSYHPTSYNNFDWLRFLVTAGLPSQLAVQFSQCFVREKMDSTSIPYIDRNLLRSFNMAEGDVIKIKRTCDLYLAHVEKAKLVEQEAYMKNLKSIEMEKTVKHQQQQHLEQQQRQARKASLNTKYPVIKPTDRSDRYRSLRDLDPLFKK